MTKNKWILAGVIIVVVLSLGLLLTRSRGHDQPRGESKAVDVSAKEMFETANSLLGKNETLKAKELFQKIIAEHPDFNDIETVQRDLEKLNLRIILSRMETPRTTMHEVATGDSLGKIAGKYNTTVELIKKSNGLTNDVIRVGQRLRIWLGVFSVFVDKSQNTLILKSDDEIVKVYNVATGKNNCTPVGTFKIVTKLVDPVWYKSGAILPPESPKNALGSRWMGFDIPGYGIHGTIEPDSIGTQATEGCVRMVNPDVEELFSLLPVATQVTVVD